MKREGLQYLAYSLTHDPVAEIQGALTDVSSKSWQELQSLDKLVSESAPEGTLEAEVQDAPVYVSGSEANYRVEASELPINYQDSGYKAADDDDDAEVAYADVEAQKTFEKELDDQIHYSMLNLAHVKEYRSAEHRERVENHKISLGYAMRFLLTAIKMATS